MGRGQGANQQMGIGTRSGTSNCSPAPLAVEDNDELYADWSLTHDYDPRWDYNEQLRPDWQHHPLVIAAQARLDVLTDGGGRVFALDLSDQQAVGMYAYGTGVDEPAVFIDPYQHEHHTASADQAHAQVLKTVDHEYRHAEQEALADGEPDWDEDDAEDWRA